MKNNRFTHIAFYKFTELSSERIPELRKELRQAATRLSLKGTVILSPEGVNGFMAGEDEAIRKFQDELAMEKAFTDLQYKVSFSNNLPFQRLFIKVKKEIIPLGRAEVQPARVTGDRLSPQELKKWYEEKRAFHILDTRNEYEIKFGRFEGAISLGLDHFRQFPDRLKETQDALKDQPIVMYCTGGIRCEKATVIAMDMGFKNVFQLDGGILKYFEECGGEHFTGDCFVFDERVALNSALKESPPQS